MNPSSPWSTSAYRVDVDEEDEVALSLSNMTSKLALLFVESEFRFSTSGDNGGNSVVADEDSV